MHRERSLAKWTTYEFYCARPSKETLRVDYDRVLVWQYMLYTVWPAFYIIHIMNMFGSVEKRRAKQMWDRLLRSKTQSWHESARGVFGYDYSPFYISVYRFFLCVFAFQDAASRHAREQLWTILGGAPICWASEPTFDCMRNTKCLFQVDVHRSVLHSDQNWQDTFLLERALDLDNATCFWP